MDRNIDIYKDFNGYNSYPILDAEKIIRERQLKNFAGCIELIKGCEEKAKKLKTIKMLEKIISLKKKMNRLENEFISKGDILKNADRRLGLLHVDEEKLKNIDYSVAEEIKAITGILESMDCAETDVYINKKFSAVNKSLNDIEKQCKERLHILLK